MEKEACRVCAISGITPRFNNFSFTGESGIVYRGYLNTRGGNELVAIKTGKRKF